MTKEYRLQLRLDGADAARLDVAARRFSVLSRADLIRAALRLGIERLEREGLAALDKRAGDVELSGAPTLGTLPRDVTGGDDD